jgi:hypothetical protein
VVAPATNRILLYSVTAAISQIGNMSALEATSVAGIDACICQPPRRYGLNMETKPTPAAAPAAEGKESAQESGNVIPFRPRAPRAASEAGLNAKSPSGHAPGPQDLAKYERGDGDDDYRHRMVTNAAALLFTIVLAGAGAWLAITIGEMRKNQDCFLSGRRNCSPIDVPVAPSK